MPTPKNKPSKTIGQKQSNESKCNSSSTASPGLIEPSSLYTCKDGTWLTYLDGLALENRPFIAHYTSPEKS